MTKNNQKIRKIVKRILVSGYAKKTMDIIEGVDPSDTNIDDLIEHYTNKLIKIIENE